MKNADTAAAYTMSLLLPHMNNGRMKENLANEIIAAHHATALITLNRKHMIYYGKPGYIYTKEGLQIEREKEEKRTKAKAIRAEIARLQKELAELEG